MSRIHNDSIIDQSSLCDRISVSWRASFSVRMRYEIACAIAIIGLLIALLASAAVYVVFNTTAFSDIYVQGCLSLGLSPIPLAISSLILGICILLSGIYLLPEQST
ncbi:hypothetical protein [Chlamydia sp. 17-3921]|uniref:hypothetical protein n=1 Tax=Chlamydia sp. 17-3921 TaxID=2675798 RepID=UPI001918872A|nr:hypothetical protein [Chlamydia sp. 17-3921]